MFAFISPAAAFTAPLDISNSAGSSVNARLTTTTDNAVHAVWMECGPRPDNPCPAGGTCQAEPPCAFGMYHGGWLSCREGGVDGLCCNTPPADACGGTAPACNGVCPSQTESCTAYPDGTCKCVDAQTACEDSPDCTGSCGQGLVCQTVFTNICQCVLNQSCGLVGGFCGGYCPGGDVCASNIVLTGEGDEVGALFSPCSCQNTCYDGTVVWQCSTERPRFCDGNSMSLINNCSMCGCPQGTPVCTPQGSCTFVSSFSVQTRDANGNWAQRGLLHYGMGYSTQSVDLGAFLPDSGGAYRVRLVHTGGALKGFIDAASLSLDGIASSPTTATMVGNGVLQKLAAADSDVLDATGATVELSWGVPATGRPAVGSFALTAREESAQDLADLNGSPMYYPAPPWMGAAFATYLVGSTLSFTDYWVPASGHPAANVTGRIWTDGGTLRAEIDVAPDNTRDIESDWAQFEFTTAMGTKTFRVSEANASFGRALFAYAPSVSWEHRAYEFAIPFAALGASPGAPAFFRFSSYGTLIQIPPPPIECDYPDVWKVMYANNTGGSWHAPVALSVGAFHSVNPQIVSDAANALTVVWKEYDGNPQHLFSTRSADTGASWSVPAGIAGAAMPTDSPDFEIAAGSGNAVGLLWDNGGIMSFVSYTGGWGAPSVLDNTVTASEPALAANPLGGFGAAWRRGSDAEIYLWRSGAPGVTLVSRTVGNSDAPDVAFDSAGTAHVAWRDANDTSGVLPGQWDVWYAGVGAGGVPQNRQDISNSPNVDSRDPQVAVDKRDAPSVVWSDATPGNFDVYFSRSPDGGASFSAPADISSTGGFSSGPRIAADGNSNLHVLWEENTGNGDVYYAGYNGAWHAATGISNTPSATLAARIAVDSANRVHAVFQDSAPGAYDIYYTSDSGYGATQEPALRLTVTGSCAHDPLPLLVQDQSGNPIPNAIVGVSLYNTQSFLWDSVSSPATDANGSASFTPSAAGYYKFIASKGGYAPATKYVTTTSCAQTTPQPTLAPSPTQSASASPTPAANASPGPTAAPVPPLHSPTPAANATPTPAANATQTPLATATPESTETPFIQTCTADADCGPGDSCENGVCTGAMREPGCCPLLVALPFLAALGAIAFAARREK